jgi:hypothetical protein
MLLSIVLRVAHKPIIGGKLILQVFQEQMETLVLKDQQDQVVHPLLVHKDHRVHLVLKVIKAHKVHKAFRV